MLSSMKKTYVFAVILAAAAFLFSAVSAFADTYQVKIIKTTQSKASCGIDSTGDFVSDTMLFGSVPTCRGIRALDRQAPLRSGRAVR
jgi:hypothetical protein